MAAASKTGTVREAIDVLGRLSEVYRRRRAQLAARVGLTEFEWLVLERVSEDSFMPSLFARQRESSIPAVSRVVRQVVDKGLVQSSVSKDDRRKRDFALTASGRKILETVQKEREKAIRAIWLKLDSDAVRVFKDVGQELAGRLEAYAESHPGSGDTAAGRTGP